MCRLLLTGCCQQVRSNVVAVGVPIPLFTRRKFMCREEYNYVNVTVNHSNNYSRPMIFNFPTLSPRVVA